MSKAAGIKVTLEDGKFLLLKRGQVEDYPGYWTFPGGHVEDGESDFEAALRECEEECGFRPTITKLIGTVVNPPPPILYTTFIAQCKVPSSIHLNKRENVQYTWATEQQARKLKLHPGVERVLEIEKARYATIDLFRVIRLAGSV